MFWPIYVKINYLENVLIAVACKDTSPMICISCTSCWNFSEKLVFQEKTRKCRQRKQCRDKNWVRKVAHIVQNRKTSFPPLLEQKKSSAFAKIFRKTIKSPAISGSESYDYSESMNKKRPIRRQLHSCWKLSLTHTAKINVATSSRISLFVKGVPSRCFAWSNRSKKTKRFLVYSELSSLIFEPFDVDRSNEYFFRWSII